MLVDVSTLVSELDQPDPPVLLDVRWTLARPSAGRADYLAGHLPGATFVDLETELAAHPESPTEGRHPLPDVADLQQSARRWGIRTDSRIVVYDATSGLAAARAWWLLRWAGVHGVRILDGGLAAWLRAGHQLEAGECVRPAGDVSLDPGQLQVISPGEAAACAWGSLLLDARAGERYRGEVEPIDSRAGHIPGAVSAPTTDSLNPDGTFKPVDALRAQFEALGAGEGTPIAVYCGSGVTAAHEIAALAIAGFEAALFPGSWSAWSADPDRPAATGAGPAL